MLTRQDPRQARGAPAPARRAAVAWPVVIISAAILAAYANSLGGPFVLDDVGSIVNNPTIRSLASFGEILSPPWSEGQTVGGRPVLNLSLAVNYALGGLEVRGYHVVNLGIHLSTALLLFGWVRRTIRLAPAAAARPLQARADLAATGVALLWAVHPMGTAAVTYVVQRAESLAAFFVVLTLDAFSRGVVAEATRSRRAWHLLGVAACFLAMGTKESAAAAPVLVFLYDRTFLAGSFREAWRRRWPWHIAHAASWLLLATLVSGTADRGGSAGLGAVTSSWDYLLTQADAITRYLRLAVWPSGLTFDYGSGLAGGLTDVAAQASVVVLLLAASLWALVRYPTVGFIGAWFFLLLAPSSSVVPVASQTIAEHRMYLPLVAIVAAAVLGLVLLPVRSGVALGAAAAVALAATTIARHHDYRSASRLWSDTVAKRPQNTRAWTNLGTALAQEGRTQEAMTAFREALRLHPRHAAAHYNLGVALAEAGATAEAHTHLAAAAALEPTWADARVNLGNALVRLGRPAEAVSEYEEALRLQPGADDVALNLGLALLAAGRADDAVGPLRRAVAAMPRSVDAHVALGNAHARQGAYEPAAAAFGAVLRLEPRHVGARINLANALLLSGRTREAIAHYEAVLRERPDDLAVRANLDQARAILRAGVDTGGAP